MKQIFVINLLVLSLLISSCQTHPPKSEVTSSVVEASIPSTDDPVITDDIDESEDEPTRNVEVIYRSSEPVYDLEDIAETIILPRALTEISGLSYDVINNGFIANNDEKGTIYHVGLDGKIVSEASFGKDSDYEGIEKVREDVVVVKSNGNLYFYNEKSEETIKVKTDLNSKNDIEGLTFFEEFNLLLLACKGQTLNEENEKKEKVVYAYNLELGVLHEEPFLVMGDPEHLSFVEYNFDELSKSKKKALQKRIKGFSPSGIAIHPINKDIYVLSARGSAMVIYDMDHNLKDIMFFDEGRVPQPEGICFNPDGAMYVSTEGRGLVAKIFRFDLIQ